MVSKSKRNLQVTGTGDTVSIHKWVSNAGRFMSFTREEALVVASLLQEVLNDPLSGHAAPRSQSPSGVPK